MVGRNVDSRQRQDRRKQIVDRRRLALNGTRLDGQPLLMGIRGIRRTPGRDERNSHSAFIVRPFLATQRRSAGDSVLMSQRCIRAVIAEEENHGVFRHSQRCDLVKHVAKRFVHPLNQCRERLRLR